MPARRLLVVDDEPAIRQTLSSILAKQGFEVTIAGTVLEALQAITNSPFDILIADLNIGQPGDGFTVVSAMRRTYPDSIALILTGFPAFEAALKAIREQVDDFLVKPVHPAELVERISEIARSRRKHVPVPLQPLADIIRSEKPAILRQIIDALRKLGGDHDEHVHSDKQLLDSLPEVIDEMCDRMESRSNSISKRAAGSAKNHGKTRFEQGYGLSFILDESTIIRQLIIDAVHHNLLRVDLSSLMLDLSTMSITHDQILKMSITEYARLALGESERTTLD